MEATLAFEERGSGPAVVLLHAFPLSSRMWARQIDALADRYRGIAPDRPGFGRSPPRPAASMASFAGDVLALLDALGVLRAAAVGLSMGGYVAFELLDRAPHRLAALALCDTRASPDSDEAKRGRETSAHNVESAGAGVLVEGMLPKLLAQGASREVRDEVEALIRGASSEGTAAALRAMAGRRDFTDRLPTLRCPTLVLVGEQDVLTTPADAEQMAARIPGAELTRIPSAGHLSNLEQPEAFNAALAEFLDRAL